MANVITANDDLNRVAAPRLPTATKQYDRQYQDQFNNILRLYFNQLDNILGQLNADPITILTNPTIINYTEGVVSIGTVTTAHTFDLTNGTLQTATLTASTACTFTMPTASAGKSFLLVLSQAPSTGNGTATFTGALWSGGTAPTIAFAAGSIDMLSFVSDGTNWYGAVTQNFQ
jgi:hypothetical protein